MEIKKKAVIPVISLLLLLIAVSCGNLFNTDSGSDSSSTSVNRPSSNIVTFTGSVSAEGALPASVLNELNDASGSTGNSARTALPSIDSSTMYYFAKAEYSGGEPVYGTFVTGANASSFTIALELGHRWTITAGLKKKPDAASARDLVNDTTVMEDTYTTPELSTEDPILNNHVFLAQPLESGTGEIGLTMTVDSSAGVGSVAAE